MVTGVLCIAPLVLHPKLATQEGRSTRNVLLPIPWYILFPRHFQLFFHGPRSSVKTSRIIARSQECRISLFSYVATNPHHHCSVANMTWDPLASVRRMLTILEFWLVAQTALTFILHVSLKVYRKAGLDVRDTSLASGSADVLGYEVSLANAYCSGTGKRISRIRPVARMVSSCRRIGGRAMELVNGHESLFWRSAIMGLSQFLTQASCSGWRLIWFPDSFVSMEQRASARILCLLRIDWSVCWLDVCIGTDASEKGFAFAVRDGCRELASEVGRVSELTSFERSSRSIRARSRALRSIVPEAC